MAAAPPRGLPPTQGSPGTGLTVTASWEPAPPGVSTVVLASHATSVPFTAVLAGPERTLTEKTTTAATCGDHHIPASEPARSGFGSRWSVGPGLHRPCRARPADRSLVAEDRSAGGVRDQTGSEARCSRNCSRDGPRNPGMSGYKMGRRGGIRPARRPGGGQESTGQHAAWAILGTDVPTGALAGEAGGQLPQGDGVSLVVDRPVKVDRRTAPERSGWWLPSRTPC
jgi:hypothetical protein